MKRTKPGLRRKSVLRHYSNSLDLLRNTKWDMHVLSKDLGAKGVEVVDTCSQQRLLAFATFLPIGRYPTRKSHRIMLGRKDLTPSTAARIDGCAFLRPMDEYHCAGAGVGTPWKSGGWTQ